MITLMSLYISFPVKQNEYAIGYDTYNMKFTKIYEQGKYPIRVGEDMIIIKRTLQDYNNNLKCMTKDKILIDLSISLQYLYFRNNLIDILKTFSSIKKFNEFLFDTIENSIVKSCLMYDVEEYYTKRNNIDDYMYNNLIYYINNQSFGASIEFFQLVDIQFPTEVSNIITEKQNIEQETLTALNERTSKKTDAQTALYEMQRQADVILINAYVNANITINQANSNLEIQQVLWNKRAYAYYNANDKLKLNSTEMIDFIQTDLIYKSNNLLTNLNF